MFKRELTHRLTFHFERNDVIPLMVDVACEEYGCLVLLATFSRYNIPNDLRRYIYSYVQLLHHERLDKVLQWMSKYVIKRARIPPYAINGIPMIAEKDIFDFLRSCYHDDFRMHRTFSKEATRQFLTWLIEKWNSHPEYMHVVAELKIEGQSNPNLRCGIKFNWDKFKSDVFREYHFKNV